MGSETSEDPAGADGPGAARWHGTRDQALSFGAVADGYERLRPGYPAAAVAWALGPLPRRVADVGAGTGKLTRVLRAAGHDVVAVEPDPQMRTRLATAVPGVVALDGTGERIPLPDSSVDAVTFAQAWHWVDPDRGAPEVARVLRPDGVLALVWNVREPGSPFAEAVRATVADIEPALVARATADTEERSRPPVLPLPGDVLLPDGTEAFPNDLDMTVEDAVGLAGTWSYVALSARRDALLADLRDRLVTAAGPGGRVVLGQHTRVHRYRRSAG